MKTIKLTDDQFNTLFNRIDKMAKTIIDASVEYQDSDMLNEWEDFLYNNQFNYCHIIY